MDAYLNYTSSVPILMDFTPKRMSIQTMSTGISKVQVEFRVIGEACCLGLAIGRHQACPA